MNSTILYSLITFASATIALIIKYSYQSKCTNILLCWGMVDITRNTADENKEDQFVLNHKLPTSPSQRTLIL